MSAVGTTSHAGLSEQERRPLLPKKPDAVNDAGGQPPRTPLPLSECTCRRAPTLYREIYAVTDSAEQVLVLCLMRFAEPVLLLPAALIPAIPSELTLVTHDQVAFSLIFPFISQFIEDLKVTDDPSRIGYYAGIIVSLLRAPSLRPHESEKPTPARQTGILVRLYYILDGARLGSAQRPDRYVLFPTSLQ